MQLTTQCSPYLYVLCPDVPVCKHQLDQITLNSSSFSYCYFLSNTYYLIVVLYIHVCCVSDCVYLCVHVCKLCMWGEYMHLSMHACGDHRKPTMIVSRHHPLVWHSPSRLGCASLSHRGRPVVISIALDYK